MILEILFCIIGALVAWTFYVNWNYKNIPKGPFKLPLLGNFHQAALFAKNNELYKLFMEYEATYGKIFSFQLGSYPAVILNDYKLIKEAWNNPMVTGRPVFLAASERCGDGVIRGLIMPDGDEWAEQRRFTLRHLRDFGFGKKSMEALIMDEVVEFLEGLKNENGKPVSTQNRFNLSVVNALWTITAGDRFSPNDPELVEIVEAITRNANGSSVIFLFMPWIVKIWPSFPPWVKYAADLPFPYNFLKKFTDKRLANYEEGVINNFTDIYIDKIKKTADSKSSFFGKRGELTLTATLLDLFVAGAETTSTALTWACFYLSIFQDKQKKLQEEIDRVLGTKLPSEDYRPNMPYTEAAIMETMRFSSVLPLGVFHRTISNVVIGGHYIPNNTMVIGNLHAVHHDQKTWGDPNYFKPERFLSHDETSIVKHEALIPFSIGKRVCIGETLARNELFLFVTSIFQKFDVVWDPSAPKPSLEQVTSFVASPRPHKLVFTQRI